MVKDRGAGLRLEARGFRFEASGFEALGFRV